MATPRTVETTPAEEPEYTRSHREILEVMVGLLAALFTCISSSTIVANALPTIVGELKGSQTQYTWVVTASLLAMTVSTAVWGKLSDLFNKKVLVQIAIVIFVIGSALAGMSQSMGQLLSCRALQGIGMGGLLALSQSIIGSIVSPRDRGRYSGYMGATGALAMVSGPLIGGVIVDAPALGWRWCFYVCVPLALISLSILQRHLRIETIKRPVKIDYFGGILVAIAATLPLIWVSLGGDEFAWVSAPSAAFLIATAVAVALAVWVEHRHPEPLVPPQVMRERTTVLATIAGVAVGCAMFGMAVFLSQFFQTAQGHSPTEAGLMMIPMMAGSLVGSIGAGNLITRYGRWKRFLVIGAVLLTAGLAVLGLSGRTTPYWHVGVGMMMMGLGMGMMQQNLVLAVQNTVDVSEVGAASGAVAFFRTLGGAVGVSVLGAILASQVSTRIATGLPGLGIDPASMGSSDSLRDSASLPGPVLDLVRTAYADATAHIFLIAAAVAAISLFAVLFIKEAALRLTVRKYDEPPGPTA